MAVRSVFAMVVLAGALVLSGVGASLAQGALAAAPLRETPARQAIVIDGETGAVLFEKNADEPFPPASLAKLMTVELALNALATGLVTEGTAYPVSENAWRTGGVPSRTSTMFAEVRSSVPVIDLLRGIIVQQANDGSIILAEGLEGTEGAFVQAMNQRAAELGLTSSRFVNATGLPAEGQAVTARDLARLARHLASAYPDHYAIFAEPQFTWNGILQRNRNPLLSPEIGGTGLATGFTEGAGYAIVGAAEHEGRTTFIALGGLESEQVRRRESAELLAWARDGFERRTLFPAGQAIGRALVYGGTLADIPLQTGEDVVALVPGNATERMSGALVYDGPLRAPVRKGDPVGRLEVRIDGRPSISQELYAAEDVAQGTFSARVLGAVQELAFGWIRAL